MKLNQLMARVDAFLNAKKRERKRQAEELKDVLKDLKKKERKLKREAGSVGNDEDPEGLIAKLEVVRAQRKKGVAALKALRKD